MVRLIRLDPSAEQALAQDPAYQAAMRAENWPALASAVLNVVGDPAERWGAAGAELHWGGYVAIDEHTGAVVGSCAFKSPPAEGAVEIAYFTYPGHEGRGYGTAMARELLALVSASAWVGRVIAHTLPQESPSTRILRRIGMRFVGEVVDPDDGPVWRWERRLSNGSAS